MTTPEIETLREQKTVFLKIGNDPTVMSVRVMWLDPGVIDVCACMFVCASMRVCACVYNSHQCHRTNNNSHIYECLAFAGVLECVPAPQAALLQELPQAVLFPELISVFLFALSCLFHHVLPHAGTVLSRKTPRWAKTAPQSSVITVFLLYLLETLMFRCFFHFKYPLYVPEPSSKSNFSKWALCSVPAVWCWRWLTPLPFFLCYGRRESPGMTLRSICTSEQETFSLCGSKFSSHNWVFMRHHMFGRGPWRPSAWHPNKSFRFQPQPRRLKMKSAAVRTVMVSHSWDFLQRCHRTQRQLFYHLMIGLDRTDLLSVHIQAWWSDGRVFCQSLNQRSETPFSLFRP